MNSLLDNLIKASNQGNSFHIMLSKINEKAEEDCMREARELENDGFIILERCDRNDFINNERVVTLKGTLTNKSLKLKLK